jgi:hypothetical protein
MNCEESKELMVAYIEDLLDAETKHSVEEHLKDCASCQAKLKEISNLRDRLVKNGKVLAQSNIENVVLDRIIREQNVKLKAVIEMNAGQKIRRIIMKSPIIRLAAAAVIVIAAVFGVSKFFGGTVTFAKVIKPILNARTVVLDLMMGEEDAPVVHDIVVGTRIRRTFSNMDTILILDLDNAKMLSLDPKNQVAMYIDIKGPISEGTRSYIGLVRNIVNDIEKHPDWPVQELGQQEIDGQTALGFRVSGQNEEITIWADPKTALPVRIEMLLGRSFSKPTHYILKNIEFDVPVDESIVSMEPPESYKLTGMEYSMNQFTEEDFVESLHIRAEFILDDRFPETIGVEDLLKIAPLLGEKLSQSNLSEEEGIRIGVAFGRGMMFFQKIVEEGCDWYYAGKGVRLGEADKAIFWYRPKDSQTYRVVYGDLRVENMVLENLPK